MTTLTQRIERTDAKRSLPDNVIPFRERERRSVPRWIEWTQANEKRGKDLSGYIGPDAA